MGTVQKAMTSGVRRLSWEKMQTRREQGLCFNCDEKFTPGHRCKSKQAYLIEPVESEGEETELGRTGDAKSQFMLLRECMALER